MEVEALLSEAHRLPQGLLHALGRPQDGLCHRVNRLTQQLARRQKRLLLVAVVVDAFLQIEIIAHLVDDLGDLVVLVGVWVELGELEVADLQLEDLQNGGVLNHERGLQLIVARQLTANLNLNGLLLELRSYFVAPLVFDNL